MGYNKDARFSKSKVADYLQEQMRIANDDAQAEGFPRDFDPRNGSAQVIGYGGEIQRCYGRWSQCLRMAEALEEGGL